MAVDNDVRLYRFAMFFLGAVLLLIAAGQLVVQVSLMIRAHEQGVIGVLWAHAGVVILLAVLYATLGVLALRLYYWTAWAVAGLLGLMSVYSSGLTVARRGSPTELGASIGITLFVAALAALALLAALKARRIRARGFTGRSAPRPLSRGGSAAVIGVGAAMLSAIVGLGLVARSNDRRQREQQPDRDAAWRRVAVRDAKFSAEMPGEPRPSTQTHQVPQGELRVHLVQLEAKGEAYILGVSEYPEGFIAATGPDAETIFDKGRDACIDRFKARVVSQDRGTLGGFPRRTVVMSMKARDGSGDDVTMTQIMVLARGRMYIAQSEVLAGGGKPAAGRADRFLQSVRLTAE